MHMTYDDDLEYAFDYQDKLAYEESKWEKLPCAVKPLIKLKRHSELIPWFSVMDSS